MRNYLWDTCGDGVVGILKYTVESMIKEKQVRNIKRK